MSRAIFNTVMENIAPSVISKNDVPEAVGPEKQFCVALWYFANQEVYRSIADRFGLSINTAWRHTIKVARVSCEKSIEYIRWPEGAEIRRIEQSFRVMTGFPNIIGAVDGSHIEIAAPSVDAISYINRKGFHALLMQGICDDRMKFIDVFAGMCGSVHDSRVWALSDIKAAIDAEPARYFPGDTHIIGDKAYGLQPFLLTPYRDLGRLTPTQVNYNTTLSRNRIIIERALCLLKGRCRRLKYLYLQKVKLGPLIILACAVLHNKCLEFNDEMNEEILAEEQNFPNEEDADFHGMNDAQRRHLAERKRDNIAEILMQERRH